MTSEKFYNAATRTLVSAITSSATTATLSSAIGPANYRLRMDDEIVLVTAVSGPNITMSRAQEGTTAAAHSAGATCIHLGTGGAVAAYRNDYLQTAASDPIDPFEGALYHPSNSRYLKRWNGSSWDTWGPVMLVTVPNITGYTAVNQGGSSVDATTGSLDFTVPTITSGIEVRQWVTSYTAPKTMTIGVEGFLPEETGKVWGMGLCLRDSTNSKFITWGIYSNNSFPGEPNPIKWNDANTLQGVYLGFVARMNCMHSHRRVFRIVDDGTDLIFKFSVDGLNFQTYHTISRTDFMTPNQTGIYVVNSSATYVFHPRVYHHLIEV